MQRVSDIRLLSIAGIIILFNIACSSPTNKTKGESQVSKSFVIDSTGIQLEKLQQKISDRYKQLELIDVQKIDPRIKVDLKYASTDNFLKKILYDTIQKAYLNKDVASRLRICQNYLDSIKPGYRLVIFDAIRPVQVQKEMWDALDSLPPIVRGKYVSNPARGSVHNYGAAVDISICDEKGDLLKMGAGFDEFKEIAYPSLEWKFLQNGELTQNQIDNRKLLRDVMRKGNFVNIPTEWWHFNAYSRWYCQEHLPLLMTESGLVKLP